MTVVKLAADASLLVADTKIYLNDKAAGDNTGAALAYGAALTQAELTASDMAGVLGETAAGRAILAVVNPSAMLASYAQTEQDYDKLYDEIAEDNVKSADVLSFAGDLSSSVGATIQEAEIFGLVGAATAEGGADAAIAVSAVSLATFALQTGGTILSLAGSYLNGTDEAGTNLTLAQSVISEGLNYTDDDGTEVVDVLGSKLIPAADPVYDAQGYDQNGFSAAGYNVFGYNQYGQLDPAIVAGESSTEDVLSDGTVVTVQFNSNGTSTETQVGSDGSTETDVHDQNGNVLSTTIDRGDGTIETVDPGTGDVNYTNEGTQLRGSIDVDPDNSGSSSPLDPNGLILRGSIQENGDGTTTVTDTYYGPNGQVDSSHSSEVTADGNTEDRYIDFTEGQSDGDSLNQYDSGGNQIVDPDNAAADQGGVNDASDIANAISNGIGGDQKQNFWDNPPNNNGGDDSGGDDDAQPDPGPFDNPLGNGGASGGDDFMDDAQKDPLAIDLSGNGLHFEARSAFTPYFDFDGGDFAQNTAWIGSGTAFLASLGTNGTVSGPNLITSFTQLASLDANGDGVINASDPAFANLVIWQDINNDGIAQPNELLSLSDAGITSLSLSATTVIQTIDGATVAQTASATMQDGSTREVASVDLDASTLYTQYVGNVTPDSASEALPNFKGYGTLPDLRIAMTSDSALEAEVSSLASASPTDVANFDAGLQSVLYEWAGVSSVSPSTGDLFDGQKLAFLRAYFGNEGNFGTAYNQPEVWFGGQTYSMQRSWDTVFTSLKAQFLVQMPGSDFANDFVWDASSDLILPKTSLSGGATFDAALLSSITDLGANAPTDSAANLSYWLNALTVVAASIEDISQYEILDASSIEAALAGVVPSLFSPSTLKAVANGALTFAEGAELGGAFLGTTGSDFAILPANSTFTGLGGNDEILVNGNSENVEIKEVDNAASPTNVLAFGAGISADDVSVSADSAGDAILKLTDGTTVKLDDMFAGSLSGSVGSVGHTYIAYGPGTKFGVQEVQFADGTVLTGQQLDTLQLSSATSGNDDLFGTNGADIIDGEGGNDVEQGQGGNDTFVFNAGYGHLEINEVDTNPYANNVLQLGTGIDPSQVTVSGDSSGDAIITVGTNGDQIKIDGMLDQTAGQLTGVQTLLFADGTVWSAATILAKQAQSSDFTERLTGTSGADNFNAGAGNMYEQGNGGGDAFVFDEGYGQLEINEKDSSSTSSNVLNLGSGITAADIAVSGDYLGNVVLTIGSSGDRITLDNYLDGSEYGVQTIHFADGTSWSRSDVLALCLAGTTGSDNLYGTSAADTIDGQGGSDFVQGGGGGDTFVFDAGYGQLEISESDGAAQPSNVLELGPGLTAAETSVTADSAGDLTVHFGTGGDQVKLDGMLGSSHNGVQSIDFADGTVWDRAQIIAQSTQGTSGSNFIYGTSGADTLDGDGGNDFVQGYGGGDTFIFNSGYGELEIKEQDTHSNPANVLLLGAGITAANTTVTEDTAGDLTLNFGTGGDQVTLDGMLGSSEDGVQSVDFADGTTWDRSQIIALATQGTSGNDVLYGTSGADIFDGKGGDDVEQGGGGNDTFDFNPGYGHLEIKESDFNAGANNVLALGAGINPSDVTVSQDSSGDVVLTDGVSGDQIVLYQMLNGNIYNGGSGVQNGVQSIDFADGIVWQALQVIEQSMAGTTGNDTIQGTNGPDVFDGKGGNDVENGNGGNDTFDFNSGYGHLTVDEESGADAVLKFGTGIDPSNVKVTSDGYSYLLTDGVTGDQVTLLNQLFWNNAVGVQTVSFVDGTTWSAQDLLNDELAGTTGDDNLYGTSDANHFDGKGGNDLEHGGGGNDTFVYNSGYGDLEIDESNSTNAVLQLGAGINPSNVSVSSDGYSFYLTDGVTGDKITLKNELFFSNNGVQTISFANGTTWTRANLIDQGIVGTTGNDSLYGSSSADVFDGKGGNDYESGGGGNDTFVFDAGYGHLEIEETNGTNSVLQFGAGIDPSDVTVTSDGFSYFLTDGVSGDQITLNNQLYYNNSAHGIQAVSFADGTTWSVQDLLNKELTGTTGNDNLYGTSDANVIDGHGGNDYESGDGGADTFVFNAGYGHLKIDETNGTNSVLQFGAGIDPSDVTVTSDGFSYFLTDGVSGDQITLNNQLYYNSSARGIQAVSFADGTTWSVQDLLNKELTGTTGNDNLYGTSDANVIDGHGGNDYESGDGGADTFVFNAGYGHLKIDETNGTNSVLQFGAGIDPADVTVTSDGFSYFLTDGVSGDQITLNNQFYYNNSAHGVQTVSFADGTTWSAQDLLSRELTGTTGNNNLYGTNGANVFDGGGGNDYESGGGGNDTFVFDSGYGHLEIYEQNSTASTLQLGSGIAPSNVSVTTDGTDFILTDGVSGDQIKLDDELYSSTYGVQSVSFAGGTTWSVADLYSHETTGTSGNDTIYGSTGNDTINGNGGTDSVYGRGGTDTYDFSSGNLTIDNHGGSAAAGELDFGAGINDENLWFSQSGSDLLIREIGTSNRVTINGWFGTNGSSKLSEIKANGNELDSQLQSLVSAMATYSSAHSGFDPATATAMPTDTTLQSSISTSWHAAA